MTPRRILVLLLLPLLLSPGSARFRICIRGLLDAAAASECASVPARDLVSQVVRRDECCADSKQDDLRDGLAGIHADRAACDCCLDIPTAPVDGRLEHRAETAPWVVFAWVEPARCIVPPLVRGELPRAIRGQRASPLPRFTPLRI